MGFCILLITDGLSLHLQYRSKVSWQSLASQSLRRETRFSKLLRIESRVSMIKDQGSSFKFWVEKALSLKVYTYLSFWKSRLRLFKGKLVLPIFVLNSVVQLLRAIPTYWNIDFPLVSKCGRQARNWWEINNVLFVNISRVSSKFLFEIWPFIWVWSSSDF